ncbi:hypothetical protein HHI36_005734 [Cryptolaemus montrouzieri]|uniref:Uncharacterized protein n=1 Tax=Cryptolaemus montrouzieri TaxID=559131 RepID=A0ABD2NV74_9CUCU
MLTRTILRGVSQIFHYHCRVSTVNKTYSKKVFETVSINFDMFDNGCSEKVVPTEIREVQTVSVASQCGDASVDQENIVVLAKCYSPQPDVPEEIDLGSESVMEAEQSEESKVSAYFYIELATNYMKDNS